MIFLYDLIIKLLGLIMHLLAFQSKKANLWIEGRKNWKARLQEQAAGLDEQNERIWIHCASLGEFEQGRPIIEAIKGQHPEHQIILTFFSPSGYTVRKNYPLADIVTYLPLDTRQNAEDFVGIIEPTLVIFVKYEFWYHFLKTISSEKIPLILISALFRPNQLFFKPYGGFYRSMLKFFSWIFVQNKRCQELLLKAGYERCTVTGDTRVDRVATLAEKAAEFPEIAAFCGDSKILICGSTWPEDNKVLVPFVNEDLPENWKVIIAPHEIKDQAIKDLEDTLNHQSVRYSRIEDLQTAASVLIIDNIGMLSAIYQYGDIAYIGGAFRTGLHNTLEPVAFGLPVIFGPKYQNFEEAVTLVEQKAAFSIHNLEDLIRSFDQLNQSNTYQKASATARSLVDQNRGATKKILETLTLKGW